MEVWQRPLTAPARGGIRAKLGRCAAAEEEARVPFPYRGNYEGLTGGLRTEPGGERWLKSS